MPKSHGVWVTAAIKTQSLDVSLVLSLFISQPSVLASETLRKEELVCMLDCQRLCKAGAWYCAPRFSVRK